MAEVRVDLLRDYLECRICLDTFENPKRLQCNHHFCQRCLEDILHFEADGSAKIVCPLRCDIETHLGPTDTVSKLPISYEFKGILETLTPTKDEGHSDAPKCSCGKAVSIYCCKSYMCLTCYKGDHSKNGDLHEKMLNLTFNRKTSKLEVSCQKHATGCAHFFDDNFFCPYCMKRDEKALHHEQDTVRTSVDFVKEFLLNEQKQTNSILEYKDATERYIVNLQKKLEMYLDIREKECLVLYEDYLSEKKADLMNKYKDLSAAHSEQYFDTLFYSNFLEDALTGRDVFICTEKATILQEIDESKKRNDIYVEKISLSPSFNFLSEQPLGDVFVSKRNEVLYNNVPSSTFLCTNKDIEELEVKVKVNFESLSQLITTYEKKITSIETRMKMKVYEQKLDSFKEEVERIKNEKNTCISEFLRKPLQVLPQVFLEISVGGVNIGKIIIDLYCNDVPKTCENFIHLCLHTFGFGYKNSKISDGGYHYGGAILGNGKGKSIYGPSFERENFIRKHDDKGIVTMRRTPDTSTVDSRFDITPGRRPDWDKKDVAFGKVTAETYHVIEKMKGDSVISDCGVFR